MLLRYERWPARPRRQFSKDAKWKKRDRHRYLFLNDKDPSGVSEVDSVYQAGWRNQVVVLGVLRVEQIRSVFTQELQRASKQALRSSDLSRSARHLREDSQGDHVLTMLSAFLPTPKV